MYIVVKKTRVGGGIRTNVRCDVAIVRHLVNTRRSLIDEEAIDGVHDAVRVDVGLNQRDIALPIAGRHVTDDFHARSAHTGHVSLVGRADRGAGAAVDVRENTSVSFAWVVFSDGSYYEPGKNHKYKKGSTGFGMWAMNTRTGKEILLAGAGEKNTAKSSTYTEALAILAASIALSGCDLTIYTDSQCCIDTFRNLPDLAQGNFAGCKNANVWREIYRNLQTTRILLRKVKGHAGVRENEIADRCAEFGNTLTTDFFCTQEIPRGMPVTNIETEYLDRSLFHEPTEITFSDVRVPSRMSSDATPSTLEINIAINRLKTHTASGHDGILPRTMKNKIFRDRLHELVLEIWKTGKIPRVLLTTKLAPIAKSGPGGEKNLRGIAVQNCAIRVITGIILARTSDCPLLDFQFGFRRERGCAQAIHVAKTAIQAALGSRKKLFVCFIDLSKAYDCIPREHLPKILEAYGCAPHTASLILTLYDDVMWIKADIPRSFKCKIGVKQGCALSPRIFNMFLDTVIRKSLPHVPGALINNVHYTLLAYADDIAVFAENEQDLQRSLDVLSANLRDMNLLVNIKKTEYMVINGTASDNKDSTKRYNKRERKKRRRYGLARDGLDTELSADRTTLFLPREVSNDPRMHNLGCPDTKCEFTAYCHTLATGRPANAAEALRNHIAKRHGQDIDHTIYKPTPLLRRDIWQHSAIRASQIPAGPNTYQISMDTGAGPTALARVSSFKYLGTTITDTGSLIEEIKRRCHMARQATKTLELAWKHIRARHTRARLFRTLVVPVLFYGAETWTPNAMEMATLSGTYHNLARRAVHMTRKLRSNSGWHAPTNDKVRQAAGIPDVPDALRAARLRLFGQMYRNCSSPTMMAILDSDVKGTKRGGTRRTWREQVKQDILYLQLDPGLAEHKEKWAEATNPKA